MPKTSGTAQTASAGILILLLISGLCFAYVTSVDQPRTPPAKTTTFDAGLIHRGSRVSANPVGGNAVRNGLPANGVTDTAGTRVLTTLASQTTIGYPTITTSTSSESLTGTLTSLTTRPGSQTAFPTSNSATGLPTLNASITARNGTTVSLNLTQSIFTFTSNSSIDAIINGSISSGMIPVIVLVNPNNASTTYVSGSYNIGLNRYDGNGLAVTISSPGHGTARVLMLNLGPNSFLDFSSHVALVTVDGTPIAEATSLSQVLHPSPTDPPRYILVAESSGSTYEFFVSFPDLSRHVVRILPATVLDFATLIVLSGSMAIASALGVTLVIGLLYMRRTRASMPLDLQV